MKKFATVFLCLILVFLAVSPASAFASSKQNKTAVLFILNRMSIKDLNKYELPNIKKLLDIGSLALMNTKTAGSYSEAAAYLTIGTGTRAAAGEIGGLCLNKTEVYGYISAEKLYHLYTGKEVGKSDIVNIGIQDLINQASTLNYTVTPGLLGQLLKENGINVYVFGNADVKTPSGTFYNRYAPLIGMDKNGLVQGDVSEDLLVRDENSPYMVRADYEKLYEKFLEASKDGGLIIIDPGDILRADVFSKYASPSLAHLYREKALQESDRLIGKILANLDLSKDLFIAVTPYPSNQDIQNKNLITPVIVAGPSFSKGFATSNTTKREGIIANLDIAPTILTYFNIKPPVEMLGHPIETIPNSNVLHKLLKANTMIVSVHNARPPILKGYVLVFITLLVLYIGLLFLKKDYLKYLTPLLLGVMTVPLTFLVLPLFGPLSLYWNVFAIILITFVIDAIIMLITKNALDRLMAISLITSLTIIIDLLLNSPLMKNSILGYDVISGARYYGIGNEYMGVLIGSSIMGISLLIEKYQRKTTKIVAFIFFTVAFVLMVLPQFGAKVGGFITGFMAFGTTILMFSGIKMNKKNFLIMFFSMVALLFLMFVASMFWGTTTHMAQTAIIVKTEGINSLLQIFTRKLQMELKLMRYTIWSWVLVISIVVLFIISYKPTGVLQDIFKNHKYVYFGFFGSIIGMLFALGFNDAGIVAAATICIYTIPPILLLLQKKVADINL
ncbi:MAG: Uncharacterized protein XD49_1679 [Caldanaerobacter subterraneus]|uniref:Phosphoglyceromutase n=1 Tax=Caldanaerobacter subterraneus TaxID=911092 RepID=A0A101E3N8_9THEO|nr:MULTISPECIES: hypothetical protein [Caldanaerobacter]KUK08279.1 MAG: Uncharacterized protein XD49_1679 [Caldanaerobacter subterraneus]MDI3519293.1 hypothetical protein [Caldanaerobacter sp.]MDK2794210.1 hypothetical protein [Caldanaerobacter sp.]TCO68553.1 hypothetical protein EV203_10122 [Caldanaerobacter subterraneus]HBT50444.1 hypothetical protein [Caldanaerobacter subterraneus]